MALLLNLDTSLETAGIYLAADGRILAAAVNESQNDHASWIHQAIQEMMSASSVRPADLEAVAVTAGPGSYTGLRVGMATAKGLCFALEIPLITLNTLTVLAAGLYEQWSNPEWACPMIDARRMEVFTAVYDPGLKQIQPPAAIVLEANSFTDILNRNKVIFFGSGAAKWKKICPSPNALFYEEAVSARPMAALAEAAFRQGHFASLAYTEPVYLKEFYTPSPGGR